MGLIKPFVAIGVLLIFYMSWLPNPDIGNLPLFPGWLGSWINTYGNLRTAVPFLFLGIFSEIYLKSKPENNWTMRLVTFLILFLVVIIAETGQLIIPKRHFDLADIGWGVFGSATGMGICSLYLVLLRS